MYDREGTMDMGLNMGMVYTTDAGLSFRQHKCYVYIVHLDPKASEEEELKSSLIDRVFDASNNRSSSPFRLHVYYSLWR